MKELLAGDLVVLGRILPASNHTFFAEVVVDDDRTKVVYKPVTGERPLWDFTDGTLANREYAAWLVSEALGWSVVPPTVLRDGPAGEGMVQLWCEPDPEIEAVDLLPAEVRREGYLHVLDATDAADRPVQLVHEDSPGLRRMALFDVVVNNTDRKGGHVLAMTDGRRYGVDHGICFHPDDKLRTVLWGWAGELLTDVETEVLGGLVESLGHDGELEAGLAPLLTAQEISRTLRRCRRLLEVGRLPAPVGRWPAIPWPPF